MQTIALNVAALIFLVMSIAQLLRVIFKVRVTVNDRVVPVGLSMIISPALLLAAIYMFIAANQLLK